MKVETKNLPKKILISAPFPPLTGGMPTLAKTLADHLENDGHSVYRLQLSSGYNKILLLPLLYIKMVYYVLNSDIVHIISASGVSLVAKDLPLILISNFLGRKAILHFVGGGFIETKIKTPWFKILPFKLATHVVLPTNQFKNLLLKNKIIRSFNVIPHIVDTKPFINKNLSFQSDRPILICAKGMDDYAGHSNLLNIFQKIQARVPKAELWFTSDGPERVRLEDKKKKLGLNNVKFFGIVSENRLINLFKNANILVHATKYESFGIALVEAMTAGLPIVAYNVGGIPDVVENKKSGFVIEYLNEEKFVDCLMMLIKRKELYYKMQKECIKRGTSFNWNNIRPRWEIIYGS